MPTGGTIHNPQGGPMAMVSTNRPPLRRAVYVHVSDLTSPYNIDHARLEEELARVNADKETPVDTTASPRLGVPAEVDTTFSQRRLQPPRGGYNLCVLVGKVDLVVDKNRVDGSRVRLAEVEVGDETGTVSLRARDEQIDLLKEVSERNGAVVLRNCTLELYQGKHIRLAITKWGKLSPYPDQIPSTPPPPSKINRERNFSMIDLSLVASEMVVFPARDSQTSEMEGSQPQQQQQQQSHGATQMGSQQTQSQMRRGSRRTVRTKPVGQAGMPVSQHYTENIAMRYPGGLHGYGTGFEGGMDPQQYQFRVQQERLPSTQPHQQMMMQHQYGMQQRHMQQMYHSSQSQQQDHQSSIQPTSPMLGAGIPNVPSFDSSYSAEVPMSIGGMGPFFTQQQQQQQQQQQPDTAYSPQSSTATGQQPSSGSDSPASPKMNPQAATFDPSSSTGPTE